MGGTDVAAESTATEGPVAGRSGGTRLRVTAATVALAAVAVGVWLLVQGHAAGADEHLTGDIVDFDIVVSDEPITVGDTITFTNFGDRPHTVTDRGNTFDTDAIEPGANGEVTFTAAGTYEIFCRINPGTMNATVVVEPGDEDPDQVRVQTFDPGFDPREEELRFDPPEVQVRPGTEVSVANVGGTSHSLTAENGEIDTGEIEPGAEEGRFAGDNASFTVDEPGVYEYFCSFHPDAMQGTLIVAGDPIAADDPDPPPDEPDPDPPPDEPDPAAAAADAVDIGIQDFEFGTFEVAVNPGGELRWSNEGGAPHTATFDDVEGRVEGLDTGTIDPGGGAALTAPEAPGSYSYFCAIHPSMRGVVVVSPDGVAAVGDGGDATGDEEEVAAAPPPDDGDSNIRALIGAIAVLVAGLGAVTIAWRARSPGAAD